MRVKNRNGYGSFIKNKAVPKETENMARSEVADCGARKERI